MFHVFGAKRTPLFPYESRSWVTFDPFCSSLSHILYGRGNKDGPQMAITKADLSDGCGGPGAHLFEDADGCRVPGERKLHPKTQRGEGAMTGFEAAKAVTDLHKVEMSLPGDERPSEGRGHLVCGVVAATWRSPRREALRGREGRSAGRWGGGGQRGAAGRAVGLKVVEVEAVAVAVAAGVALDGGLFGGSERGCGAAARREGDDEDEGCDGVEDEEEAFEDVHRSDSWPRRCSNSGVRVPSSVKTLTASLSPVSA